MLRCCARTTCGYWIAMERVVKEPKSPPGVTNFGYPKTSVMRILYARATTLGPTPDFVGAGEKPKPGIDGATR